MNNQAMSPDTMNFLTVCGFIGTIFGLYLAIWEFWKKRASSNRRDDVELSKELESICNQPNPHPLRLQVAFRSMFKRTLEPEKILFIWNEMPNPIPNIRQFLLGHPYVDLDIHNRHMVYGKSFTKRGIILFKFIMFTVYALFALSSVVFINYWHAGKTGGGLGFNILILIYLIGLSCIGLHGSICLKAASKSVNELKFPGSRCAEESLQSTGTSELAAPVTKNAAPQKIHPKSHSKHK